MTLTVDLTSLPQELLGDSGGYGLLVGALRADLSLDTPLVRFALYRDDPVPQVIDVFVPKTITLPTVEGRSFHPSDVLVNTSMKIRAGKFTLLQGITASWGYFRSTHEF